MPTPRKPVDAAIFARGSWQKENYFRGEIKAILGSSKPMSEATFKRRLALLEECCPECDRMLYARSFSNFQKWCLVKLEEIFTQCERNTDKTRQYLLETGLPTHEYFNFKE